MPTIFCRSLMSKFNFGIRTPTRWQLVLDCVLTAMNPNSLVVVTSMASSDKFFSRGVSGWLVVYP